jgi:hypothetical protein
MRRLRRVSSLVLRFFARKKPRFSLEAWTLSVMKFELSFKLASLDSFSLSITSFFCKCVFQLRKLFETTAVSITRFLKNPWSKVLLNLLSSIHPLTKLKKYKKYLDGLRPSLDRQKQNFHFEGSLHLRHFPSPGFFYSPLTGCAYPGLWISKGSSRRPQFCWQNLWLVVLARQIFLLLDFCGKNLSVCSGWTSRFPRRALSRQPGSVFQQWGRSIFWIALMFVRGWCSAWFG